MSFDFSTLVTDRTQADVEARNDKGTYQAADLNRVTAAMEELAARLSVLGYVTDYQKEQPDGGRLPEGYTELEYIESSGTQYIETYFVPNQDTRVVIDFELTQVTNNVTTIFGQRNGTAETDPLFYVFHVLNSGRTVRSDYFGTGVATTMNIVGKRIVVDKNKNVCNVGGTVLTNTVATGQGVHSLYLFGLNDRGTKMRFGAMAKLYSCQIYDNGTLVRDYIPCKNPSNKAGLYDKVTGAFYGNAGTGDFVAGPEVSSPSTEDPYAWYKTDIPTAAQMSQYITNINALRGTVAVFPSTPDTPENMELLDYIKANNIEKILIDIDQLIQNMTAAWYYSGELYCWEG